MGAIRHLALFPIAFLLATASRLQAQSVPFSADSRWLRVERTSDLTAYIDRESINRIDADLVEVWNLWEFVKPQEDPGSQFNVAMFRWPLDCKQRRMKPTEVTYYRQHTFVRSESLPLEDWRSVSPQSTGEALLIRGCQIAAGQPFDTAQ